MVIRFATNSDVPAILELLRQVGGLHHDGRPDIFRAGAQKYSASEVIALLADPKKPIFIAAEGEKVLGYGFCQIETYQKDPVMTDRVELYLDDLCVENSCRGQGVGKALLLKCLASLKEMGYVYAFIGWPDEDAIHFYEEATGGMMIPGGVSVYSRMVHLD